MITIDNIKNYAKLFHLNEDYLGDLFNFFQEIDKDFFEKTIRQANKDFPNDLIMQKFSEKDAQRFLLLCIIANYPAMENFYKENNYPQENFMQLTYDVKIWVEHFVNDLGYAGISWRIYCWLSGILNGRVMQFGRLQYNLFHLFTLKLSFYKNPCDKKLDVKNFGLYNNAPNPDLSYMDKCINIHIPASGNLNIDDCVKSIHDMLDFVKKYKPDYDYKAIVCYSWLLDEQFQNLLPENSNIVKFQKLGFNFSKTDIDQTDEVIWRLWGSAGDNGKYKEINHKSSMQKKVAEFLNNGGKFSEGVLVIFKDDIN